MIRLLFKLLLLFSVAGITKLTASETSPVFIQGTDTLVVYKDVPGLNPFVPGIDSKDPQDIRVISDKYTIRVRSAATNNEWVDVFTHYTYSRGLELPKLPMIETGQPHSTNTQHYPDFTRGWSHTYGNIEMSKNQPVEVEIAASPAGQQNKVNITFRDIRVHDPRSNMAIFNMVSYVGSANSPTSVGCSYDGVLFQNISIASSLVKQRMLGCAEAPWYGGIIFDNVSFGGVKLTEQNFNTYFNNNEFVKDLWFRIPENYTITRSTNPAEGAITLNPQTTTFIENSKVTATAVPIAGYEFVSWGGDVSGTSNPLEIVMTSNKTEVLI